MSLIFLQANGMTIYMVSYADTHTQSQILQNLVFCTKNSLGLALSLDSSKQAMSTT
jgi:hypothetical protein